MLPGNRSRLSTCFYGGEHMRGALSAVTGARRR
jgi:hypothetical protein